MTGAVSLGGGRQLKQYITRLLYAIILVMPLHPWLGDALVIIALLLSVWDTLRYSPLSRPASWLQWCVLGFMGWSFLSALGSARPMWTTMSWLYNEFISSHIATYESWHSGVSFCVFLCGPPLLFAWSVSISI